ncbi:hypothetical protein C3B47_06645 [Flavobacterium columnare]|nr:hypothetical protein [Flavobacterium columnare]
MTHFDLQFWVIFVFWRIQMFKNWFLGIRSKTCGIDKLSKQIGCSKKDSSIFLTPLNLLLKADQVKKLWRNFKIVYFVLIKL